MMADDAKRLVRYLLSRLRKSAWESSAFGRLQKDFRSLPPAGAWKIEQLPGEEDQKFELVFTSNVI